MAGRINQQAPQLPFWPWPRNVREKLVERAQLDRKLRSKRSGDPKNPPLASAALLEFMGPGRTSDALRLPPPPPLRARDADAQPLADRAAVEAMMQKGAEGPSESLQRLLARLQMPPERAERLRALLAREAQMLAVLSRLQGEIEEVQRRVRDEQNAQGY